MSIGNYIEAVDALVLAYTSTEIKVGPTIDELVAAVVGARKSVEFATEDQRDAAAAEHGADDERSFDRDALVSNADGGYWVQGWLWVGYEDSDDGDTEEDHSEDCENGMHSWVDDHSICEGTCDYCGEPYS